MNECKYPTFSEPPTDHACAHTSMAPIVNLVDPECRVELENFLSIREFPSLHALIHGEHFGIQASEPLLQELFTHLDISSRYHRSRW